MASFQKITLPDGRALSYSLSAEPSPESPIVLLANSLCADATSWAKVLPVLQDAGFRTLRYNQPGHGASDVPADLTSTTFDSIADDVRVLLESLGISKVHAWVGVSMGAATGLVFVTKYPGLVSRLVVCDTITCSPATEGGTDLFGPRVAAARKEGSMDSIIQGTLTRWFGDEWMKSNPEETSRMRNLMRSTTVDGFETCCAALRSSTFDLRPLFAKVASGVDDALLVVGSKDANLPQTMNTMREKIEEGFQKAGKAKKKVQLKVIPDAGHVCYVDGLERFCEAVVPFLKAESR